MAVDGKDQAYFLKGSVRKRSREKSGQTIANRARVFNSPARRVIHATRTQMYLQALSHNTHIPSSGARTCATSQSNLSFSVKMPPASKKRKFQPTHPSLPDATAKQRGIRAFGRVSKAGAQLEDRDGKSDRKRKYDIVVNEVEGGGGEVEDLSARQEQSKKPRLTSHLPSNASVANRPIKQDERVTTKGTQSSTLNRSSLNVRAYEPPSPSPPTIVSTSQNAQSKQPTTILPETPTKGARARLENLGFSSSSLSGKVCRSHKRGRESTPPSSPPSEYERNSDKDVRGEKSRWISKQNLNPKTYRNQKEVEEEKESLPAELQDLQFLHSVFLIALSLHFAHHGTSNPVDVRELLSTMGKSWRKRNVTVDDVRKIVALSQQQEKSREIFNFLDYRRGKICIEMSDSRVVPSRAGRQRPLDESALKNAFLRNLSRQWATYKVSQTSNPPSADVFVSSLPLSPLTQHASTKANPLLAKGQRRLEDLKAGAIRAQERVAQQQSFSTPQSTASQQKGQPAPMKSAGSRASALLDRLHAKALHQSTLQAPPSAEEVAHRRALARLTEVAPVIASLALGSQKHNNDDMTVVADENGTGPDMNSGLQHRQHDFLTGIRASSFTMPTLAQHLQTSLRNPIAVDEAGRCVRLLAKMVPEWIEVRELGRLCVITVRGNGIGRVELDARVRKALDDK